MCSRATRIFSCASKIFYASSSSYTCRVLEPRVISHRRTYSTDNNPKKSTEKDSEIEDDEHNLPGAIGSQYQTFRDEDASIIFDVDEEKKKLLDLAEINALQEFRDPYEGLNMNRGVSGVYEIEDLVQLLRRDKAKDIFVVSVPPENSYVDYIVVVTGKSARHMIALATFVRKVYKVKANKSDILPKIEGPGCKNWIALDLGNIALHIFSREARDLYDLESLWTVGGKFDVELNKPDAEQEFAARYNRFLEGLQPADANSRLFTRPRSVSCRLRRVSSSWSAYRKPHRSGMSQSLTQCERFARVQSGQTRTTVSLCDLRPHFD